MIRDIIGLGETNQYQLRFLVHPRGLEVGIPSALHRYSRRTGNTALYPISCLTHQMSGAAVTPRITFGFSKYNERSTYSGATSGFFNLTRGGAKVFRFMRKEYRIGHGYIGVDMGRAERHSAADGGEIVESIQRPLVLLGVTQRNLAYVLAGLRAGRGLDPDALELLVDPVLLSPKTEFKGARSLFNKHIKNKLEGITTHEMDLKYLFKKPKMPIFTSPYQKEKTLERVGKWILENS